MQSCRLCALHKFPLLDVASHNSDGFVFIDLIYQYLAIKVDTVEGKPSVVCSDCGDTLTMFDRFAGRCRDAQRLLQQHLDHGKQENSCDNDDSKPPLLVNEQLVDLKKENIKKEEEDDDYVTEGIDDQCFEYDDNWMTTQPDIKLKIRKKRGRKRKVLKGSHCEEDCISGDMLFKLEDGEIKCEEITHKHLKPKRKYKKRCKEKVHKFKLKRAYRKGGKKMGHLEDAISLMCYICGKSSFETKADLRKHEKSHIAFDKKCPWPCLHCEKGFKDRTSAVRHIRVVHEGVSEFICHSCGRAFNTKGNLEDHLTTHSDIKNFECDKCAKKFKLKHALKRHLDTHQDTIYQCPKCAQLLNSRRTLRNHLYIHDEVGRQECTHCGKRFKLRKTLKVHMLTHTGERPYKCPWCLKTFTNNSNCRIHKKRIHPLELMKYEAEQHENHGDPRDTHDTTSEQSTSYDWTLIKQQSSSLSTTVSGEFAIIKAKVQNPMLLKKI